MKLRLNVNKNKARVENEDDFLGKLILGTTGKVKLRTPFGKRDLEIENKSKKEE